MPAEASCPQVGHSLTDKAKELLEAFAVQLIEDTGKEFEEGLTKQVALLTVENEQLRQENEELRERLEASKDA